METPQIKRTIYATPMDYTTDNGVSVRIPYFYLHGEAETRNGYDCCDADINVFRMALRSGLFLTTVQFIDGTTEPGLVFCKYDCDHMYGEIVLLSDLSNIEHNLKVFKDKCMYSHEIEFIKEHHPSVYELYKKAGRD